MTRLPKLTELYSKGYSNLPNPVKCEYCGKELDVYCVVSDETRVVLYSVAEQCNCDGEKKHQEELAKIEAEETERQRKAYIQKLYKNSGIPPRYMDKTFKNYKADKLNQSTYNGAKFYAENYILMRKNGKGLRLVGPCGIGKTHLAAAIAQTTIEMGFEVIFLTPIELFSQIKKTYSNGGDEYSVLNKYKQVELLILDDLGKEQVTEWGLKQLYDIINYRYDYKKTLIITTNYSDDDLIKRYTLNGDDSTARAIVSRLKEMTVYSPLCGDDWRGKREQ